MRLLNIYTLEFQEFQGNDTPPYVTTSHRWIGDEITYWQFLKREAEPQVKETPGYKKIISFCQFMRRWGKDLLCPSGDSSKPNSNGDCRYCFSREFPCDQQKPTCSNCRYDGLPCEYDIPKAGEPAAGESKEQPHGNPQDTKKGKNKRPQSSKSCKACAIAKQECGKEMPSCSHCEQEGLSCDYETALATTSAPKKQEKITELQWIWIDTCCIDKSSSQELGEAINSMFQWYSGAYACLAYMQDVRSQKYAPATIFLDFKKSSWFTRGWTLQELLAPRLVVFLNQDWEVFGHKAGPVQESAQLSAHKIHMPLNPWISRITGIKENILYDYKKIKGTPMSTRIQWMKGRNTTRIEDRAYCLLGICDVFMELIYGEKEKAYDRLEAKINTESTGSGQKVKGLRRLLMNKASFDDFDDEFGPDGDFDLDGRRNEPLVFDGFGSQLPPGSAPGGSYNSYAGPTTGPGPFPSSNFGPMPPPPAPLPAAGLEPGPFDDDFRHPDDDFADPFDDFDDSLNRKRKPSKPKPKAKPKTKRENDSNAIDTLLGGGPNNDDKNKKNSSFDFNGDRHYTRSRHDPWNDPFGPIHQPYHNPPPPMGQFPPAQYAPGQFPPTQFPHSQFQHPPPLQPPPMNPPGAFPPPNNVPPIPPQDPFQPIAPERPRRRWHDDYYDGDGGYSSSSVDSAEISYDGRRFDSDDRQRGRGRPRRRSQRFRDGNVDGMNTPKPPGTEKAQYEDRYPGRPKNKRSGHKDEGDTKLNRLQDTVDQLKLELEAKTTTGSAGSTNRILTPPGTESTFLPARPSLSRAGQSTLSHTEGCCQHALEPASRGPYAAFPHAPWPHPSMFPPPTMSPFYPMFYR